MLSPSAATFADVVIPLLAEAHERLAALRSRHGHAADVEAATTAAE